MKKKLVVKIMAAFFFLAVIFLAIWFWNKGRRIHFLEYDNASTIDRAVVYYSGGRTFQTAFTDQKDIQKIIQYFQSMQLKKSVNDNVDGFLTEIVLSRDGEDKYSITIRGDEHISVEGVMYDGFYKGDRDYGDGFRLLFEELTGEKIKEDT